MFKDCPKNHFKNHTTAFKIPINAFFLNTFYVLGILSILSPLLTKAEKKSVVPETEIHRIKSFDYNREKGLVAYGSRLYENNCQSCHGPVGFSYLSRLESPRILGFSAQQIVDRLVYYRDADYHKIILSGPALLMSNQVLFLNDEQINSIARYFEEIDPDSELNIAREKARKEAIRRQVQISKEEIRKLRRSVLRRSEK